MKHEVLPIAVIESVQTLLFVWSASLVPISGVWFFTANLESVITLLLEKKGDFSSAFQGRKLIGFVLLCIGTLAALVYASFGYILLLGYVALSVVAKHMWSN